MNMDIMEHLLAFQKEEIHPYLFLKKIYSLVLLEPF